MPAASNNGKNSLLTMVLLFWSFYFFGLLILVAISPAPSPWLLSGSIGFPMIFLTAMALTALTYKAYTGMLRSRPPNIKGFFTKVRIWHLIYIGTGALLAFIAIGSTLQFIGNYFQPLWPFTRFTTLDLSTGLLALISILSGVALETNLNYYYLIENDMPFNPVVRKLDEMQQTMANSGGANQRVIVEREVVIKEVVKVPCQYCGALVDVTSSKCPGCGAPFSR